MSQYPELDKSLTLVRDQLLDPSLVPGRVLDMCEVVSPCGTVGCIAGWIMLNEYELDTNKTIVEMLIDHGVPEYEARSPHGASDLFYMWHAKHAVLSDVKTAHAITAIENFLATGEPRWNEIFHPDWRDN